MRRSPEEGQPVRNPRAVIRRQRLLLLAALSGCGLMVGLFAGQLWKARGDGWALLDPKAGASRCVEGTVPLATRCCLIGQHLQEGHCLGKAERCPPGWQAEPTSDSGCAVPVRRVRLGPYSLQLAPEDWESQGVVGQLEVRTGSFEMDATEVTFRQWASCNRAGRCPPLAVAETELPVTGITGDEAERYCNYAGGRLPTGIEWLAAALGGKVRRFPWGQTGLVCRRAVFGMVRGSCGRDGHLPEAVGSRPEGATSEGLFDMAGNVAEWSREPEGYLARGGSFRSRVAAELKTWATEAVRGSADHVGFRCVYDISSAAP